MERKGKKQEIDLKKILFKFRAKWMYFVLSLAIALSLGFILLKTSPELYSFNSTLLLGQQNTGSVQAQELLNMLDVKDKTIKIEDEIGVLHSYEMIYKTLDRLDFNVTYHLVKDNWLNKFAQLSVQEVYEAIPFKVILDSGSTQVVNVPVYVERLPGNVFRLQAEADKAKLYDFSLLSTVDELIDFKIDTIISANEPYRNKHLNFSLLINELPEGTKDKHYFMVRTTDGLTRSYQNRLQAKPISRDSRILSLNIEGSVPKKELRFLNTLMSVYIERDLEHKNETGIRTVDFLDQQITQIADSLQRAEAKLATFRSANQMANPMVQSSMSVQKLEQLQSEKSTIITHSKFYQNTLASLKTNSDMNGVVAPTSMGIETPVLNSLIIELNQMNKQRVNLAANSNRSNPLLETLDEQIKNTKDALRENLVNMLRSSDIAQQEVNQAIARVEEDLRQAPENERQLNFLQSKSSFNDRNYDFLLEKRTEAAIALATNTTDKKVIDKASMVGNGPTSPNRNFIMMVSLMLGLVLPAGLILLLDGADNTIRSAEDVKDLTNLPFLGAIAATDKNGSKLVMVDKPRSAVAESFRSLRINLQYIVGGKARKVIGLTSTISGEGKTFCSVNLASELAISGKKTLLVEVDLRKPTQGKYLEYPQGVGLSTYLSSQNTLDEIIHKTPIKNLDIIASGPIPPNPIELVGSQEMERLLENLKEHYDYIVLDIPPVGYVSEYLILLPYIDVNLYIVRQKYTEKNLLSQVVEMQATKNIKNLYVVMNGLDYGATYEYSYKKKGEYYYT